MFCLLVSNYDYYAKSIKFLIRPDARTLKFSYLSYFQVWHYRTEDSSCESRFSVDEVIKFGVSSLDERLLRYINNKVLIRPDPEPYNLVNGEDDDFYSEYGVESLQTVLFRNKVKIRYVHVK